MTDNEKKMLNSISPFENSMMCAMIAGDRLEKIRGICKESFRMNDTNCECLTSEQIFGAFTVAAAMGDMAEGESVGEQDRVFEMRFGDRGALESGETDITLVYLLICIF